ncbi:PAP2 C domain containing [Solea senegalensis]|uniref:PAP2 C domain containing n=1 Tax=Solea senegalensis TaxID=28829 RepID=A0AAV6QX30_SOLSE|nr:uncharacterized protein LOC122766279 isoform X2 [Solea senegalensis]KAG7497647.1 PAP2 C domain containing [Solea senegalensis]
MEPESELSLDIMSKTDVLRVIVAEKLTTAAQEILAVVERTVAGYEQEASVFREEIDRQRRQLELLLQTPSPEIKAEPVEAEQVFPVSEPLHSGGGHHHEELQQQYELEDGSTCVLTGTGEHYEDERALAPPTDDQAPLTELDYKNALMSSTPTVRAKKRRRYLSRLPIKIRLLEDPGIEVINREVYKKYPQKTLMCPAHLQEKDFLDTLRSMFPQLADDKSFDLFMCTRKRNMFPVSVTSLTPVEVYKKIKGRSALFIRLRNQAAADLPSDLEQTEAQSHVDLKIHILKDSSAKLIENCPFHKLQCPRHLQETDFLDLLRSTFPALADSETLELFTSDKTKKLFPLNVTTLTPEEIHKDMVAKERLCLYVLPKPLEDLRSSDRDPPSEGDPTVLKNRDRSERNSRGRSRLTATSLELKIWILEDSNINRLSTKLFQKYKQQKLQCPVGLQETEFLDLLRSTFPQLAPGRSFDFFLSDRSKKLFPLQVETLTPEEIQTAVKSFGSGYSALYIRLNAVDEVHTRDNDLLSTADQTMPTPRVDGPQNTKSHMVLNVRFLQAQINVVSALVLKRNPVQELRCPRGLTEMDFLKLLKSTFPQLAVGKPFDILTSDQTRRLHPLRVKMMTPEEIQKILDSSPSSNIFIQLRGPHEAPTSVENHLLRKGEVGIAEDSPSTSDQTGLSSSHVQAEGIVPGEEDDSETSGLRWTEPLLVSESEKEDGGEEEEELNNEAEWVPVRSADQNTERSKKITGRCGVPSAVQMKKKKKKKKKQVRTNGVAAAAPLSCSVCRVPRSSMSLLIKHCWNHVEDPARLCGVCGEHSETPEELRSHLQGHLKTHNCDICGKSFLSTTGLKGHIARHKGERPYQCTVCHKAFAEPWVLNNHMTVHSPDKPHKCDICQRAFASKMKLKLHRATHTDERPFQCSMCPNSYRSLGTLSQHMLRHLGRSAARERSHACQVCDKTFSAAWKLQAHMRSHEWQPGVGKRGGKFTAKAKLLSVT